MKIFTLFDAIKEDDCYPGHYLVADSAIVCHGKPLFLPDWAERFMVFPCIAFRIGKLGKSIARKFAYRYIDGIAPALSMRVFDSEARTYSKAIDDLSFDGALTIGDFVGFDPYESLSFELSCEKCQTISESEYPIGSETINAAYLMIEKISGRNLVRNGDLFVIPVDSHGMALEVGINFKGALKDNLREGKIKSRPDFICRIR